MSLIRNLTMKNFCLCCIATFFVGCGHDFLDIRRNANQVIPKTLADYDALLKSESIMNRTAFYLNMIGADDYSVEDKVLSTIGVNHPWIRNAYDWQHTIFGPLEDSPDWNHSFNKIQAANLALEARKLKGDKEQIDYVTGKALFNRAWNYYHLATTFCTAYNPLTSNHSLGLPLVKELDVNAKVTRATLEETYRFIESDLLEAKQLIGNKPAPDKFTSSSVTVDALLAKLYFEMADYGESLAYGLAVLEQHPALLDYNDLDPKKRITFSNMPFGQGNPEVLMYFLGNTMVILTSSRHDLRHTIWPLMEEGDLRKKVFFNVERDNRVTFKGSYTGSLAFFTGVAVDEMYLLVAECYARSNELMLAADYLNKLLVKRFESGLFTPLVFTSIAEALKCIIKERRIQLLFRGTRWVDLKRYNKEEGLQTTLERTTFGETHRLLPNDSRYVWPIAPKEVNIGGLVANER